jgi:cytochrome c-type protein NapB
MGGRSNISRRHLLTGAFRRDSEAPPDAPDVPEWGEDDLRGVLEEMNDLSGIEEPSTTGKEDIMRPRARYGVWLAIGLLPILVAGAGTSDKEADDGMDVYFRDVSLLAISDQSLPTYPQAEAGESKPLERGFPDAPPQIPHTVEDMLPITGDDNECVECHHPDNAVNKADFPLPKSHFSRAVMGKGSKDGGMVWVVKGYEDAKDVVGGRYNCTMCHAPQATNVDTPSSDFVRLKRMQKED